MTPMRELVRPLAAVLLLTTPGPVASEASPAESLPPESRQFDFWIGEWDVNLRIRGEDGTWPDASVAAVARIYPVLGGKAVLELWDSEPIVGFSLRWFDPEADRWRLWLNWPRPNRSGGSGLEGRFHHGRGEFFGRRPGEDGGEVISRYTFSDITATSLRWDDAYSRDGGETWSHRWIMEFTRRGGEPSLPAGGGEAHTFGDGRRCDSPAFRRFEVLAGSRQGTVSRRDADGGWTEGPARLTGWRVLGGCAVLAHIERHGGAGPRESLHLLTWNTRAERFEEDRLDDRPGTPLEVYYGPEGVASDAGGTIELRRHRPDGEAKTAVRRLWSLEGRTVELAVERSRDGGAWESVERARFSG